MSWFPTNRTPMGQQYTQPAQPDPQVAKNQQTYQDVLRNWYKQRPKFGTSDWGNRYQAWKGTKPTGKDIGIQPEHGLGYTPPPNTPNITLPLENGLGYTPPSGNEYTIPEIQPTRNVNPFLDALNKFRTR